MLAYMVIAAMAIRAGDVGPAPVGVEGANQEMDSHKPKTGALAARWRWPSLGLPRPCENLASTTTFQETPEYTGAR